MNSSCLLPAIVSDQIFVAVVLWIAQAYMLLKQNNQFFIVSDKRHLVVWMPAAFKLVIC